MLVVQEAPQTPEHHFEAYQQDPSHTNLNAVVDSLKPTIGHALSSIGGHDDPALKIHARTLAAQAVMKYTPGSGASLATWTSNQLQQLRRLRREVQSPVHVPDRAQIDAMKLHRAEQSFHDDHNRVPTVGELADYTGMPTTRIEKVRRSFRRTPTEDAIGGAAKTQEADYSPEALGYVYHDSDHVDRRILELKTGYGGETQMNPQDIGTLLKLTPSQLSRRSARIALRVQELEEALQTV
jgi:DNA-directed RNA polymerase specialized sigma subunit